MIIKPYLGKWPKIHPTARIAENATIIGDVTIEENASIWYGAVLRADYTSIHIGKNTNIQDLVLCHGDGDTPLWVGDNCTVGHSAIVHGCVVDDHSLVGMGATLLNGSHIGRDSLVAAHALVRGGFEAPPRSSVMGVPGKITRPTSDADMEWFDSDVKKYLMLAANQLPTYAELMAQEK
jgi:carbonic anhydrase/acetyltransferase-like protein (isoleucine patch superfamily)